MGDLHSECRLPGNNGEIAGQWRRLRESAGIEDVTIHNLCRTATMRLLEAGVSVKTVQERVGHTTATTTLKFYAGVTEQAERDAVAKLGTRAV